MDRESQSGRPPEKIGPYRVESRLGVGGMGEVFRGYDEELQRPVALKRVQASAEDREAYERLRREARAIARLNHASIVQVYGWIEDDVGDGWFVMELVEGRTLKELLKVGTLALGRAVQVARDISLGLAAAHAAGIVHRDLKAENVMVTGRSEVKILDFGLAKVREPKAGSSQYLATLSRDSGGGGTLSPQGDRRGAETSSDEGQLVGTAPSMSPEQASGRFVDHRSDFFALGTLLYQMTTGISPFVARSLAETLNRIRTHRPPPVHELRAEVPEQLSDLISWLLEKDPDQRPQSAEQVVQALDAILMELSTGSLGNFDSGSGSGPHSWGWSSERSPYEGSSSGTSIKTILLCDLVASTQLVESLGDTQAAQIFLHHDRLARDLLRSHEGREIDKSDGFLLLFERPLAAVLYAQAYHAALEDLSAEEGVTLAARVGIHVGEVVLHENAPRDVARGAKPLEVEGLTKATAARLMSLARGGQTLISRGIFDMARRSAVGAETLPEGLHWTGHGQYRLKGVKEPLEVFEVGVEDRRPFARPRNSEKVRRVAPVGESLPRRGFTPAVLATLLAAVLVMVFAVTAFLVRRGALPAVEVRPTVAVLGFENLSGKPQNDWLSTALAELLTVQLAAEGKVRLIPGESVARMKRDLALGGGSSLAPESLKAVQQYIGADFVVAGSYLLLERDSGRQLSIQPILQSTRDGELLAAIQAEGAEEDLVMLAANASADLHRQLGLGAISDRQAEAAVAASPSDPRAARLYFEGLEKLRRFAPTEARDLLLKAIAEESGNALAHAALGQAWRELGYDGEAEAEARRAFDLRQGLPREEILLIEGQHYEASAQWEQAVKAYQTLADFFPDSVEYGLLLARAQFRSGDLRSASITVGFLRTLPKPIRDDPRIDLMDGDIARHTADYQRALAAAEEAIRKGHDQGARLLEAEGSLGAAISLMDLGDLDRAEELFERSIALYSEVASRSMHAEALNSYANLMTYRFDFYRAEATYQQALAVVRQTGDRRMTSTLLQNLAVLYRDRGELDKAKEMFQESLGLALEVGDQVREATRRNSIGWVLLRQGDLETARSMSEQSLRMSETSGSLSGQAWCLYLQGQIAFAAGRLEVARELYEKTLDLAGETGYVLLSGKALAGLAELALTRGDVETAAARLGEAEGLRPGLRPEEHPVEVRLMQAELRLATGRFAAVTELAREAGTAFLRGGMNDDAARFEILAAQALLDQGDPTAARAAGAGLDAGARQSQNPSIRLDAAIVTARIEAAAGGRDGDQALAVAQAEAAERGLVGLELEARLHRLELAADSAALGALAAEAEAKGFVIIARRAAAAAG